MTHALRLDACTSPRNPALQTNNSWRGGTLPRWCGCQRWGSNPSPTYFETRLITRLGLYITPRISRFRLRSSARKLHTIITHRTLSNSVVTLSTITPSRPISYLSSTKPDYVYPSISATVVLYRNPGLTVMSHRKG